LFTKCALTYIAVWIAVFLTVISIAYVHNSTLEITHEFVDRQIILDDPPLVLVTTKVCQRSWLYEDQMCSNEIDHDAPNEAELQLGREWRDCVDRAREARKQYQLGDDGFAETHWRNGCDSHLFALNLDWWCKLNASKRCDLW